MIEIEKKWLLVENNLNYFTSYTIDILKSKNENITEDSIYDYVKKNGEYIEQYYITSKELRDAISFNFEIPIEEDSEIRLRFRNKKCFLTIKKGNGYERIEINHEIDYHQAIFFKQKDNVVKKYRLVIPYEERKFEFDAYANMKLLICECEVESVKELDDLPVLGVDVTNDVKYKNINLI
jgi:CYTH domain-containing protein